MDSISVGGGMNDFDLIEQQIRRFCQSHSADMIGLCQKLLQTPSVNGIHDEVGVVEVLNDAAVDLGLEVQITAKDPNRPISIVSTSSEGAAGLLLVGHTDTVPTGDESTWTHPPFSGAMANGRIYGRGAVDTKGGMTAALWALAALKAIPGALHGGRAQFIAVPDEETGATGRLGIRHLQDNGLLAGLGAIYVYSGRTIYIGHRGLIRYKIVCRGESIHTGSEDWQNKTRGNNAVTGLAALLLRLEQQPFPHSTQQYFDVYRTLITPGTVINGGVSVNIVPDRCEALVDIRTTPEFDRSEVEPLIRQHITDVSAERPGLSFELTLLNHLSAVAADPESPVYTTLREVAQAVTGQTPPIAVAGPANEGYLLIEAGIPTVCGFGPIGDNFHGSDEYVDAESLVEAAIIYALTARRLSAHLPP